METVRKGGRVPANGLRKIDARLVNGNLIGPSAQSKWAKAKVWDVSWYNFLKKSWEPEGKPRTYKQAYASANYKSKVNPYSQLSVTLVPGYSRLRDKAEA